MGCGWCDNKRGGGVCLTGDFSGPMDKGHSCGNWTWDYQQCNRQSCEIYTNCRDCIDHRYTNDAELLSCAWSNVQQKCIVKNMIKMDVIDLRLESDQCEEKSQSCSSYNNCSDCVTDSTCAWCASLNTCMMVPRDGNLSQCADVRYLTCAKTCYSHLNCQSCLQDPACGLCSTFCTMGNSSGPSFFPTQYCEPWSYQQNCNTDICNRIGDCNTCTANGCHWCLNGCKTYFSSGCCDKCEECPIPLVPAEPSHLMRISVGIMVGLGTILFGLCVTSMIFLFWKKYWLRRHHFQTLQ